MQENLLAARQEGGEVLANSPIHSHLDDFQHVAEKPDPIHGLKQLDFWLLYFVFGVSSANGLLFLNNCG